VDAPRSIRCHPSRVSDCVGQRRGNLRRLGEQWSGITVLPDTSLAVEEVVIDYLDCCLKGSIITDLNYTINEV
jgi:hypothetical protein